MTSVNIDAERRVLAALLTKPELRADALEAQDFASARHRQIFTAIRTLKARGDGVDLLTVSDELTRMCGAQSEADIARALADLVKEAFGAGWHFDEHVRIVRRESQRRALSGLISDVGRRLTDGSMDPDEARETLAQALRQMQTGAGHPLHTVADVLLATYTDADARCRGEIKAIPYGLRGLDRFTGGLHRGELVILGARPAVGKSALAMQFALSAARGGYKTLVCSLEMTRLQYGQRVLARDSGVDLIRMRNGNLDSGDFERLADAMTLNAGLPLMMSERIRNIEDLSSAAARMRDDGGLDVLVVDYLQLMGTRRRQEKDYLRLAYISKTLKDLAVDLDVAVLALAQVSRDAQVRMPTLADLRGSGDMEQDADCVMFLHRPDTPEDETVSDKQAYHGLEMGGARYMPLCVAKNRQGATGLLPLAFYPARMAFTEIEAVRS